MKFSMFQCFVFIFLILDVQFEILLWGLIFRWTHTNRVLRVPISSTLLKAQIQKIYYYYYYLLQFKEIIMIISLIRRSLTKLQK